MSGGQQALLGAAGETGSLPILSAASFMVGVTAVAQLQYRADGSTHSTNGTNSVIQGSNWIVPLINMANYSIRLSITSGALSTGTAGSFLNLGTNRTWTVSGSVGSGNQQCSYTLELRNDLSGLIVASGSGQLQAEAT